MQRSPEIPLCFNSWAEKEISAGVAEHARIPSSMALLKNIRALFSFSPVYLDSERKAIIMQTIKRRVGLKVDLESENGRDCRARLKTFSPLEGEGSVLYCDIVIFNLQCDGVQALHVG